MNSRQDKTRDEGKVPLSEPELVDSLAHSPGIGNILALANCFVGGRIPIRALRLRDAVYPPGFYSVTEQYIRLTTSLRWVEIHVARDLPVELLVDAIETSPCVEHLQIQCKNTPGARFLQIMREKTARVEVMSTPSGIRLYDVELRCKWECQRDLTVVVQVAVTDEPSFSTMMGSLLQRNKKLRGISTSCHGSPCACCDVLSHLPIPSLESVSVDCKSSVYPQVTWFLSALTARSCSVKNLKLKAHKSLGGQLALDVWSMLRDNVSLRDLELNVPVPLSYVGTILKATETHNTTLKRLKLKISSELGWKQPPCLRKFIRMLLANHIGTIQRLEDLDLDFASCHCDACQPQFGFFWLQRNKAPFKLQKKFLQALQSNKSLLYPMEKLYLRLPDNDRQFVEHILWRNRFLAPPKVPAVWPLFIEMLSTSNWRNVKQKQSALFDLLRTRQQWIHIACAGNNVRKRNDL